MNNDLYNIARKWNVEKGIQLSKENGSTGTVFSFSSNGQLYYLKEKSSIEQIERELYLYPILKSHGIRIPEPLPNLKNDYMVEEASKLYCLYKGLPGKTFEQHLDSNAASRAFLYGKEIARLHKGLMESDLDHSYPEMKMDQQLQEWAVPSILKHLENQSIQLLEPLITNLKESFLPYIHLLPNQIIHRDAHPGNILIDDDHTVSFVDFDISTRGIRIFDLCYCATSILMSNFTDTVFRKTWFKLLQELIKGYVTINPLQPYEKKTIIYVVISIQLIFTAYFFDQDNKDLAHLNFEALIWIDKNKKEIQEIIERSN